MSAYWTVENGRSEILGMYGNGRWDTGLEQKISLFHHYLITFMDERFHGFFPWREDDRMPLSLLMPLIPALLQEIPVVIGKVEAENHHDKASVLAFLRYLGPTLRQIQKEAPTGRGWTIVAF
jgi:hypothetical protein